MVHENVCVWKYNTKKWRIILLFYEAYTPCSDGSFKAGMHFPIMTTLIAWGSSSGATSSECDRGISGILKSLSLVFWMIVCFRRAPGSVCGVSAIVMCELSFSVDCTCLKIGIKLANITEIFKQCYWTCWRIGVQGFRPWDKDLVYLFLCTA